MGRYNGKPIIIESLMMKAFSPHCWRNQDRWRCIDVKWTTFRGLRGRKPCPNFSTNIESPSIFIITMIKNVWLHMHIHKQAKTNQSSHDQYCEHIIQFAMLNLGVLSSSSCDLDLSLHDFVGIDTRIKPWN